MRSLHSQVDGLMPFAEPGVGPHYAPDRAVRIEHIDLWLSVEPAQRTFRGRATLRICPLACYAGRLAFDLDEVVVESVVDGDGAPLDHVLADGSLTIRAAQPPEQVVVTWHGANPCLLYTSPSPRDKRQSRMPSSA